ncbi:hypothetical protein V6N13_045733 [Hibiscus sabdariffa]|uniref:Uncharacterized protein n=1 Tax=Hibiscus sabdariffa TaxID=183260 RepID=A0ABR2BDS9_9ROSI
MGQELSDSNDDDESSVKKGQIDDSYCFDADERRQWRAKIREVINKHPEVEQEIDPVDKLNKMQKLLAGQFFDKITIKNNKENDDDYDSEKERVWQDDDYIHPIKDIKNLRVINGNRLYSRTLVLESFSSITAKAERKRKSSGRADESCAHNMELQAAFTKIDDVAEDDLVSALKVSSFPEIIFTKAGKILYRERAIRTADELSKMTAFVYYRAAKPPCLDCTGDRQERITAVVKQFDSYLQLSQTSVEPMSIKSLSLVNCCYKY